VAAAVAGRGAGTQLVGRIGDDPDGDALVLALAEAGVGHVALLRDPSHPTPVEPAPVDEPELPDKPEADPARAASRRPGETSPALDAGDVDLGLRYLTGFDVLVVVEPSDPGIVAVAAQAAEFADARLVVVVPAGANPADLGLPPDATVLGAPDGPDEPEPDGAFADALAAFLVALDAGEPLHGALGAARSAVQAG
jgi:hypothetical protein